MTVYSFVSDTGFLTSGSFLLALGGTNSGGSGSVTGTAWGGNSDTALDRSHLIGTISNLTGTSFNANLAGAFASTVTPYSLTIGTAILRTTPGTTTGDLN